MTEAAVAVPETQGVVEKIEPTPMSDAGRMLLAIFLAAFGAMFFALVWPAVANNLPQSLGWQWRYRDFWPGLGMGLRVMRAISLLAIPFLLVSFPLVAWLRGHRLP